MASNSTSSAGNPSTSSDATSGSGGSQSPLRTAERSGNCSDLSQQVSAGLCDQREDFQELVDDVGASVANYCRKRPLVAALSVFVAGFYVGWKIKPW